MATASKRAQQRSRSVDTVDRLLEKGDTPGAKAELERLLLEGMNSGNFIEATPQFWAELRAKLHREASTRKRKKTA
jgi:hypothetical protein